MLAIETKYGYQVRGRMVTARVCGSTESAYLLLDSLDLITGKCCDIAIAQVRAHLRDRDYRGCTSTGSDRRTGSWAVGAMTTFCPFSV